MARDPWEPKGMLPTDWFWVVVIAVLVIGGGLGIRLW
jgi:hypothetical protein